MIGVRAERGSVHVQYVVHACFLMLGLFRCSSVFPCLPSAGGEPSPLDCWVLFCFVILHFRCSRLYVCYTRHLNIGPADSPEGSCELVKWRQISPMVSNYILACDNKSWCYKAGLPELVCSHSPAVTELLIELRVSRPPYSVGILTLEHCGNLSAAICSIAWRCPEASWRVRNVGVRASAVNTNVT